MPQPTRVLFLAPGDVRKGRVEPISWMQTCRELSRRGLDVVLYTVFVLRRDLIPRARVWEHYGVEPTFAIRTLPTPLGAGAPVWWFRVSAFSCCALTAIWEVARQQARRQPLMIWSRSPVLLLPFALLGRVLLSRSRPRLVLETHTLPKQAHARLLRRVDLVVVNSERLQRDLVAAFALPAERVIAAPLPPYTERAEASKADARRELGLDAEAAIACYTGKVVEAQTDFLLETAAMVVRDVPGFQLVLVGGNPAVLEWARARVAELELDDVVELAGFVEPSRVGLYRAAADVLVLHMDDEFEHYPYATPAKAYDYMASGRPIVATDVPLADEVFGETGQRALRVAERTPDALAAAIRTVLELGGETDAMVWRAREWIAARSWQRRVDDVLRALERIEQDLPPA